MRRFRVIFPELHPFNDMNTIDTNNTGTKQIKVSVIMPIYNADEYLRPALDSVIDQTLREIEIICVDDGSTDGSLEILKEYQNKDDRIRIVTETNAGPALARNNGIRRARGEYISFLDADDFIELDMLEQLYNEAKANDLDIVITNYDVYNSQKAEFSKAIVEENEDIYKGVSVTSKNDHPDEIFTSTNGSAWNKLYKTSFIMEKKLSFLTEVKTYEDVYFVLTSLSLAERVGKVHKVLLHHRVHSEQTRTRHFRKYFGQIPEIYVETKKFLTANGMFAPLSHAFVNISASRCFKIYNLLGNESKGVFWDQLHGGYAEKLGWSGREASDYDDEDVCEFVANVQLYNHKQYKKRLLQGKMLCAKEIAIAIKKGGRCKLAMFFSKFTGRRAKATK